MRRSSSPTAKGYFAEQGLKVQFVRFDSAAKMIPSLGLRRGQCRLRRHLGRALQRRQAASASRSSPTKLRNAPGYGFEAILARTET